MERITAHGMSMPKLGLGTFRLKGDECTQAVQTALGLGYRHIDTAEMYDNEAAIGEAIAHAGLPRADLHVTTKVWWDHLAGDGIARAIDASLERLRLNHVDLYLIHWPAKDMDLPDAIEKLVAVKERGQARAIGVANFPAALFSRAVNEIGAPIACNQFEYHVLLGQGPVVDATRAAGAAVTAYCPLAQGRLADHKALHALAEKHNASPAQIALAWLLEQDGVSAIPKAGPRESQQANLGALDIKLDEADRAAIAKLPKTERCVNPGFAPVWDANTLDKAA